MGFANTDASSKAVRKRGNDPDEPDSTRWFRHALSGVFHSIPTEEKADFRCSGLPYCPLLYIDAKRRNEAYVFDKPSVGWREQFYLSLGTTAHELWQRVMTRAARDPKAPVKVKPFGAWHCTHCKRELPPQFLPAPCGCGPYTEQSFLETRALQMRKLLPTQAHRDWPCLTAAEIKAIKLEFKYIGPRSEWEYVEVGVEYKGLSGHIDYIAYFPASDRWIVVDLKTATSVAVKSPDKNLPVLKNIFQIETYAALLPKLFKEISHISEYSLLYHTRESATQWHSSRVDWTKERNDRAWRRIERWTAGHAYANEYLAGKHDAEILLDVVDQRPCLSEKSYLREMHPAFIYDNQSECVYKDLCTKCEAHTLVKKWYARLQDRLDDHLERAKPILDAGKVKLPLPPPKKPLPNKAAPVSSKVKPLAAKSKLLARIRRNAP